MGQHLPPPRRSLRTRVASAALALAGMLLLGGCDGTDLGLPDPASDRAEYIDTLWFGAWVAALVVGVFVWGLMGWVVVRYRRRSDNEIPPQVRYNLPIEVLYTIAPVIIVAVLFFHTVETEADIDETPDPDHVLTVIGQKWAWTFVYNDEDAVDGQTVFDSGSPADPAELYLPVDEVVDFELRSNDVIHAFWVPVFNYKQDVVPGRENSFMLTPTVEGEYPGRCSELCGLYHSRMLFTVHIVSRDDFDAHLQELEAAGNVGEPQLPDSVTEIAGTDDEEADE